MRTMNQSRYPSILTALTLAMLAGTCPLAVAQPDTSPDAVAKARANLDRAADYRSCHTLKGLDVTGADGKEIAEITDLVLDRGSGRIDLVVVKTGTTLGMGGKSVAVPYGMFRWNADEETVTLNSTADELKGYPAFSAEEWTALTNRPADRKSEPRRDLFGRLNNNDPAPYADPYQDGLKDARRAEVIGRVESVERARTTAYGEQVILTVKTDTGETRRVALGPSWFVSGSDVSPVRGDRVEIETIDIPRDNIGAATRVRIGERDLTLRDSSNGPVWSPRAGTSSDAENANTPYWRYVMLSDVRGMKVDCRGSECGKVADVIFDRSSGQVAFLSIDPNQNFLGIGDTKRMVPWSVATVAVDGTVRIDASKEMVVASPETPSDISTLNTGQAARSIYGTYQVPDPRGNTSHSGEDMNRSDRSSRVNDPAGRSNNDPTRTRDDTKRSAQDQVQSLGGSPWSTDGEIMKAVDRQSGHTIKGEVTDIIDTSFEAGIPNARTLIVRTTSGEQYVLLGPAAYINSLKLPAKKGDIISANVYRTSINGRHFLIASAVDGKSSRVDLWKDNVPAWQR